MKKLAALTGAGISKPSGIPTFEELGDLREKLSRDYFESDPGSFYQILRHMVGLIDKAEPNPAHLALAQYDVPVVTMNIDGLHTKAGSRDVVEIHGSLDTLHCKGCNSTHPFNLVYKAIHCPKCGGLLETNVVLYGDMIPLYGDAIQRVCSADHLFVIGTSFYTSTSYDLMQRARYNGAEITIINEKAELEVPRLLKEIMGMKDER
jgi:NAD-dependent deacetylase